MNSFFDGIKSRVIDGNHLKIVIEMISFSNAIPAQYCKSQFF